MNPLMMLLGQQAGSQAAGNIGEEILVNGIRGGGDSVDRPAVIDGRSAPNDRAIEAVQADVARGQEASDRRGMFGVKGTLRDVLGAVGDAFLVQGGRDPYYAPRRRQEQISDAWAGATEDPMAAAERVGYYDAGMGQTLLDKAKVGQLEAQKLESAATNDVIERAGSARDQIARWLGAAQTDEQRAYVLQTLAPKYLETMGLTMEQLQLSEQLTAEQAGIMAAGDMRVNQQRQLPIAQQRADAATKNAESSRIRANRPPAGRAPRAETDREAAIRIGNKPESQRTEGERVFMKKYQGSGSILETFRSRQGAPTTTGSRFRPAGQR